MVSIIKASPGSALERSALLFIITGVESEFNSIKGEYIVRYVVSLMMGCVFVVAV